MKYTIALEGQSAEDFSSIVKSTHLKGPSDVVRAAINVFWFLLMAERKGYVIFLRSREREFFHYTPHNSVQDETSLRQMTAAEVLGSGNVPPTGEEPEQPHSDNEIVPIHIVKRKAK
jgi:hypothetical protein